MVIKKNGMIKEIRNNMRGGTGDIEITHLVKREDLKNSRLLAYITIPVGASIGDHEHKEETEYYIILKGMGMVIDNGIEKQVNEGDVVITGNGESHSISNTGKTALEMLAIIITY